VVMASANPVRLSMQTIRMSFTPLAFKSVSTLNRKQTPSLSEIYIPIKFFRSSLLMAALFRLPSWSLTPPLLTLQCMASSQTMGYINSRGRHWHSFIIGIILSVISFKVLCETSASYISSMCAAMSRKLISNP